MSTRLLLLSLLVAACHSEGVGLDGEVGGELNQDATTPLLPAFLPGFAFDGISELHEEAPDDAARAIGARVVTSFQDASTAPALSQQPPDIEGHHAQVEHEVRLTWTGAGERSLEPVRHELTSRSAELAISNSGSEPRALELSITGDVGTSNAVILASSVIHVDGQQSVAQAVDLSELLARGDLAFAGQLRAVARVHDPETAEELYTVSTSPIYFHQTKAGALQVYNEAALHRDYRGGDLLAQRDLAGEGGSSAGHEKTFTLRTVAFDPAPERQRAAREAHAEATGASGTVQGAAPAVAQPVLAGADDELIAQATYTACFLFEIDTLDSGYYNTSGYTEDYWTTANSGIDVPAYGVRVKIGSTTYDTDPVNGCVSFSATSSVQDVRVYAYATNTYDTYARLHTGGRATTDTYPGSTYSWYISNVSFTGNGTTYVPVGDYAGHATAMATFAFALRRYAYGVSNGAYHITPDGNCGSAGHYWTEAPIDSAYLELEDESCYSSNLREKFTVGHEYGHAFGSIFAQKFKGQNYGHYVSPSNCSMNSSTHYFLSKEWNLAALMEGWAHFVASVIFNNKASYGQFRMLSYNEDLERWSNSQPNSSGGHLVNVCADCRDCDSSLAGAAVEADWLRQFWDMYGDGYCSNSPTTTDMVRLYAKTLNQDNLSFTNSWSKSRLAVGELVAEGQLGSCYDSRWDAWGAYNAVNR